MRAKQKQNVSKEGSLQRKKNNNNKSKLKLQQIQEAEKVLRTRKKH